MQVITEVFIVDKQSFIENILSRKPAENTETLAVNAIIHSATAT